MPTDLRIVSALILAVRFYEALYDPKTWMFAVLAGLS